MHLFAPVSCVRHTKFCMAVTNDSADVFNGHYIGEAVLVSADAGQTWWLPPDENRPYHRDMKEEFGQLRG